MVNFADVILELEQMGVADVLLPFLLIFTLVFAVLQKTRILGQYENRPRKNLNTIIALVMGLAVVIPHVVHPSDYDAVNIINRALPNVSVILVAILMMMLLIGIFSDRFDIGRSFYGGWVVIAAAIIIALNNNHRVGLRNNSVVHNKRGQAWRKERGACSNEGVGQDDWLRWRRKIRNGNLT